jgi:imidazolonepropionase-like amidohydrolase
MLCLSLLLAADALVLEGVNLIDGTGAPARPNATLVIAGGRIAAVGERGRVRPPDGARVVDVSGRSVIPGLIDAHAHVTFLRQPSSDEPQYDDATTRRVLRMLLAFGVTGARNPMAPAAVGVALRDAVSGGALLGPRLRTAGDAIDARLYPSPESVRREVDRQAALGVDDVKLYAGLTPELTRAAIDAAHEHRVGAVGHLQATSWSDAARLGIDFISHGASWSEECLPEGRRAAYRRAIRREGAMKARLLWLEWVEPRGPEVRAMVREVAQRGIAIDPTLIAYETKLRGDDAFYTASPDLALLPEPIFAAWRTGTSTADWTPGDYARGRAQWNKLLELVRVYEEEGVPLLAGSDLPNPWVVPGAGLHRELELLVSAGLSPLRVLTIATGSAAAAFGWDDAGTLEPGKRADFVVLEADPLDDIRNTRRIEAVYVSGRRVTARNDR